MHILAIMSSDIRETYFSYHIGIYIYNLLYVTILVLLVRLADLCENCIVTDKFHRYLQTRDGE